MAEQYAKVAVKPEKLCTAYYSKYVKRLQIFIKGFDSISKYGRLNIMDRHYIHEDFSICFDIKGKYKDTFGEPPIYNFNELIKNPEQYIERIIKTKNFNFTPNIVKSFNVVTLESIPVDKIKASSSEITELNILLKKYYEKQDQYTKFLNKLMS